MVAHRENDVGPVAVSQNHLPLRYQGQDLRHAAFIRMKNNSVGSAYGYIKVHDGPQGSL